MTRLNHGKLVLHYSDFDSASSNLPNINLVSWFSTVNFDSFVPNVWQVLLSSSFRCRRSTFATSIVISRGRCSTFDVSCCVFLRIALSGLREVVTSDNVQIPWQAWHFVTCADH